MLHKNELHVKHTDDHLDPLLSPDEFADVVGVPVKTVYLWNTKRTGPRYLRIGRHIRYRQSDVNAWLEQRTTGGPGSDAA